MYTWEAWTKHLKGLLYVQLSCWCFCTYLVHSLKMTIPTLHLLCTVVCFVLCWVTGMWWLPFDFVKVLEKMFHTIDQTRRRWKHRILHFTGYWVYLHNLSSIKEKKSLEFFGSVVALWNGAASISRSLQYCLCFEVNAEKTGPFLSSLNSDNWYYHGSMWVCIHLHMYTWILLNLRFKPLFSRHHFQGTDLKRPKFGESTERSKHTQLRVMNIQRMILQKL